MMDGRMIIFVFNDNGSSMVTVINNGYNLALAFNVAIRYEYPNRGVTMLTILHGPPYTRLKYLLYLRYKIASISNSSISVY